MAYTDSWNESAPAGSADANTLETIIQQQVKRAIRERLEDIFPDWSDDGVDPKRLVLNPSTARPASPNNGEPRYDSDTKVIEIYDASDDEWVAIQSIGYYVNYDDSQGAGGKATVEGTAIYVVMLHFSGTTDGSGDVVIDLSEIDGVDFETADLVGSVYNTTDNAAEIFVEQSFGAASITVRAFASETPAAVTSTAISFDVLLVFKE